MQICLIDDNEMVSQALATTLGDLDHCVLRANTGAAGLAQLSETHFDVAVIDVNLPDKNGSQLAAEARVAFPNLTVIVISGASPGDAFALHGAGAGGHAFLAKPFTPRQLIATIENAQPNAPARL